MRGSVHRIGTVVLGAALVVGLAGAPASAAPDRPEVRQALTELLSAGVAGVQLRLHDAQGDWTGAAGVRELGGTKPVPTDGRFRAGSITKTFVSTVVLQLVDEDELTLDDPISRHLPQFGLDPRITVRMLLQHTSGLFNYTGEPKPDGSYEPGIPLDGQDFVDNRYHTYQPADLVEFALARPARFEPGTQWSYSNTNYILLGMMIEKLTGDSYADHVKQRIIQPLRLRETFLPGTRPNVPGPHAHGYLTYQHHGATKTVDVTRHDPSWAGAAGEIISTTKDLDRFLIALLDGRLLPPDLLAQMRAGHPASGYGLGMESLDAGPECGGVYQGHTGGMQGYQSFLFRNDDGSTRFAMSLTTSTFEVTDPESREKLIAAVNKVVEVVTCGPDA